MLTVVAGAAYPSSAMPPPQTGPTREVLVVVALTAVEEYQAKCEKWAVELVRDLLDRCGMAPAEIEMAGPEQMPEVPSGVSRIAATKTEIEAALKRYASRPSPETDLYLFVLGSGTFDGHEYKLNLKGPDLSGTELKALLDAIPRRRQILFWGTSCSGVLLKQLASKNRLLLTATRSGLERNDPRFPGFFLESLRSADSDTDKDSRISWLEAYQSARSKTEESFKAEGHMATEHPVFDDDGDGEWRPLQDDNKGDGLLAAAIYFAVAKPGMGQGKLNPATLALTREREQLEAAVTALRSRKADMKTEEYDRKLEELLIRLARISSDIRKLEAAPVKPE